MRFQKSGDIVAPEVQTYSKVRDAITAAIEYARDQRKDTIVVIEFNNKKLYVAADSDPNLLHRDYLRSVCGHLARTTVGPWPEPKLPGLEDYSTEEMAN